MQRLLYCDDTGAAINYRSVFDDLDMSDAIQYAGEIVSNLQILLSNDTNAANNNNSDQCVSATDFCHILTIFDKLALRDIIDKILVQYTASPIPYSALIINHSLSDDALIKLYAKTGAYNLLYKCMHYVAQDTMSRTTFRNATFNGLRVAGITVNNESMRDYHIQHCTSLATLIVYDGCNKITTCAPFANSLITLYAKGDTGLCDNGLKLCTSIVKLFAGNNYKITTCAPFANSLTILSASGDCGIDDDGLALCHSIKELIANDNDKITTCEPFAKTLKILWAVHNCGISDVGIALCCSIETLFAADNVKITTCGPFAKTLRRLYASRNCGISDIGIASCCSITKLDASNNAKITTCAPFAKTLKILHASRDCGISDIGIASCRLITDLHVGYNSKITTCTPFAKSLKRLNVSYSCGIGDGGIAACHSIVYLFATGNSMITTCVPFARSLRHLYATSNESGMNTNGIILCKSLVTLRVDDNYKVDCSKIIMAKCGKIVTKM